MPSASSFRTNDCMNWLNFVIGALSILLLLYVTMTDIAARIISNTACMMLAALAITRLPLSNIQYLLASFGDTALLFALLLILYSRGYMGGGDVKLLGALSIGLSFTPLLQLLTLTALAGGVLALIHLIMRLLPYPKLAPVGSSLVRRVYAVERWRHLRHAPLPYGVAIACGGIWIVLNHGV
jgi:prepilin peptidase CpaA